MHAPTGHALSPGDPELTAAVLDAVVGQSPVGIGVFDTGLRYVRVNPALLAIIGLPESALIGRRIDELLPGLGEQAAGHLGEVIATGQPRVNVELWGSTPAQPEERRYFNASYCRIVDGAGRVSGAASFVVDVTGARRAQAEAQRATERLLLLARASSTLATSLDLGRTLAVVADLIVPDFADHCIIDLLEPDGAVRRMGLAHAPGLAPPDDPWVAVGRLVDYPPEHPCAVAMATRSGRVLRFDADVDAEQIAPTERSAEFARQVGLRSLVIVPLLARGAVVGVVSCASSVSQRVYTDADLALTEQLAARAAVAIDNARLFAREQSVALALQHSLLPGALPPVDDLETAACYLPAEGGTQVGGDWYDVVPLSAGRTGIVIGDVMGRGVHAAAVMGQLRAAVRGYAVMDLPPAEVLGLLDDLVRELDDVAIVTCVYGVHDPATRTLTLANAGHVPPLCIDDSTVTRVDGLGIPLGIGGLPWETVEVAMPAGRALVFYTDGLVESRGEDVDEGIDRLAAALSPLPVDLSGACGVALRAMGRERSHDDDIAILVVRATTPADARVELGLPPVPAAVHDARATTRRALGDWLLADLLDVTELLVSELVTNAVRHAAGRVTLRLRRSSDRLFVEVADADTRLPRLRRSSDDDEGGRGLYLVEALARRWGSRPTPEGKVVWCELSR